MAGATGSGKSTSLASILNYKDALANAVFPEDFALRMGRE